MDEVGSTQAVIIGAIDAVPSAIMFAATQPEGTLGLVPFHGTARATQADDYPAGYPPEAAAALKEMLTKGWGTEELAAIIYPERADDEHSQLVRAVSARFQ